MENNIYILQDENIGHDTLLKVTVFFCGQICTTLENKCMISHNIKRQY
jgi:hypothetical protein